MKKLISVTIGLLFFVAAVGNVSAESKGGNTLPSGTATKKMDSSEALKAKTQVRQQVEQHTQVNKKENDATLAESKDRVRTSY